MAPITLNDRGYLYARPGDQSDRMDALYSYFWGLVDAAQFTATLLGVLAGFALVFTLMF